VTEYSDPTGGMNEEIREDARQERGGETSNEPKKKKKKKKKHPKNTTTKQNHKHQSQNTVGLHDAEQTNVTTAYFMRGGWGGGLRQVSDPKRNTSQERLPSFQKKKKKKNVAPIDGRGQCCS